MEINRNNQILLNKLVEISAGKRSSVVPAPRRIREMSKVSPSMARNFSISQLGQSSQGNLGPKSLNFVRRKNEIDRIERENYMFAKKLYDNHGNISKKRLDAEYKLINKYKKNIQKVKKPPKASYYDTSMIRNSNRLPPLETSAHSINDMDNNTQRSHNEFGDGEEMSGDSPARTLDRPKAASEQPEKPSVRPKLKPADQPPEEAPLEEEKKVEEP